MIAALPRYTRPRNRHLYAVPDRRVPRRPYVPVGRALHLLDLENLMGGPFAGRPAIRTAVQAYRDVAAVGPLDLVTISTNPALLLEAAAAWAGSALFVAGRGPDGADLALLRQVQNPVWVAQRFDRVVIGSGDGAFVTAAAELRRLGIAVGVVARPDALSRELARASTYVRVIYPADHEQEAA